MSGDAYPFNLNDVTDTSTLVDPAVTLPIEGGRWDEEFDVLVIGTGLAGTATALRVAEDPSLRVMAIDRGLGGGASALSGGVLYLGGTQVQRDLGVEDSAEEMARYLAFETGNVVSSDTVRCFAEASAAFIPWLERHGARFGGPLTTEKTSYPKDAHLYFSGNENSPAARPLATPAPRGHRAMPPIGAEPAAASGTDLMAPLLAAMERSPNIELWRQTRATRLIVDAEGAVIGAELRRVKPSAAGRHARLYRWGTGRLLGILGLLAPIRRAATRIERRHSDVIRIRARRGVVIAAGGFRYNTAMVAKTAPDYLGTVPLGTIGDDGSGLRLATTVGARLDRLGTVSAWRFVYPPASWTKSVSIDRRGDRLLSEELYGARTGEAVFGRSGGKAWLVLDSELQAVAKQEARSEDLTGIQRMQARFAVSRYTTQADTLPELATKIGVPADRLVATIEAHNRAIRDGAPDPTGKSEKLRLAVEKAPFFATDIGDSPKMFPVPALTMGGIVVDEESGAAIGADGRPIAGLYAAGRSAVGLCSHYYVSGLSLADCVWSGWRAAETIKGNGGSRALARDIAGTGAMTTTSGE